MTAFADLGLAEPLLRAVTAEGYTTPTPIQAQAVPPLLDGRDVQGIAQTGTGKTAAFTLPLLQRLAAAPRRATPRAPRVLVLTPTRELAGQVADSFATYGRHVAFRQTTVTGGVPQRPQVKALTRGVEVLIATPGRLLDLMNQGHLRLDAVEALVLDEADRMLDMGFVHDIRKIAALCPAERQTVMFSATMAAPVRKLAGSLLSDPVRVEVAPRATTAERIDQRVAFVARDNKRLLLQDMLGGGEVSRALIFTRTKHGADKLSDHLRRAGISADALHGNKSQKQRERTLESFRRGRVRMLVATDVAARGLDVDGISHVINFELPQETESYVHRIGRTARAGAAGTAVTFCDRDEVAQLRAIEAAIRQPLPVETGHAYHEPSFAERGRGGGRGKPSGGKPAGQPPRGRNRRPNGAGQGGNPRRGARPARAA